MTVVETDRIEMADISSEQALDEMFEALEPVPEGLKVAFGDEIDLTDTVVGLTLDTSEFPGD